MKLAACSNRYKKELKKVANLQKNDFISSLRNAKTANPKLYWDLLQGAKDKEIPISMQDLYEHFKDLSQNGYDDPQGPPEPDFDQASFDTSSLNDPFTEQEIFTCIKQLRNNKAAGCDSIVNEFIKHSAAQLMPLYIALFNKIMVEGKVPEEWLIGLILPLYKSKGDRADANNYRGITLLSCFGKLFTSVLNSRLYAFCEENSIIKELQAGFRHGYATTDHIFLMSSLIDLYLHKKKKLFACFVDYAKAFDTVSRSALWAKLARYGVSGRIMDVLKSMYTGIKSCVSLHNKRSDFFVSLCGVRQGENLSPLLFSLFVNDLENFLLKQGCEPLKTDVDEIDNIMKLLLVMYADDTIILADTEQGLQDGINALHSYCEKWKLTVNCDKTKVVIFSKRKVPASKFTFTYNSNPLEIVHSLKYLGLHLNYNGSYKLAALELVKQGSRAMYALLAKCRKLDLPVDLQLELFDALVVPILLYNCEVWGFKYVELAEKLHLKFMKYVLNVKTSTCNSMVYGELGRYPLHIRAKRQFVTFWAKTLHGKSSKLSYVMLTNLHKLHERGDFSSTWLMSVKNVLDHCGMSNIWLTQNAISLQWLKTKLDCAMKDQFQQEWRQDLNSKSSCDMYVQIKERIQFESYLKLGNKSCRRAICQLRTNNSHLPIVTGRYNNTPRADRLCSLCDAQKMGDEYHVLVECTHETITEKRRKYVPDSVTKRPSAFKCISWLKSKDLMDTKALGSFLRDVLPLFR